MGARRREERCHRKGTRGGGGSCAGSPALLVKVGGRTPHVRIIPQ